MTKVERRHGIWWYGATPVPLTAMWSSEENQGEIRPCSFANGRPALWVPSLPGKGVPRFKAPHPVRQRRAMALTLCDICGRSLKGRTKYLLGTLRTITLTNGRTVVATNEPLTCADCVPLAKEHCPFVRSWPEKSSGWEPLVVRRTTVACTVVAVPGLREIAGEGNYPAPAVAYAKLCLPDH